MRFWTEKKESNNAYLDKAKKNVVDSGIQATEAQIEEVVNKKLTERAINEILAKGPVVPEQSFNQEDITGRTTPTNQPITNDGFDTARSQHTPDSTIAINFSKTKNFDVMNTTTIEPSLPSLPVATATGIIFNPIVNKPNDFTNMLGPELNAYYKNKYGKHPLFDGFFFNIMPVPRKIEKLNKLEIGKNKIYKPTNIIIRKNKGLNLNIK